MIDKLRVLASVITSRAEFASRFGKTFEGNRDINKTLGYKSDISIEDYRYRFRRNAVAHRIMVAAPRATWRGGGEIIEDDSIPTQTPFEAAWEKLATRLKIWRVFMKADIIAGFGNHSGILIGASGRLADTLPNMKSPDEISFVKAYAEDRLKIDTLVESSSDPRFGLPEFYLLKKLKGKKTFGGEEKVHWSRVIHVCDDVEDDIYAPPRLECVWDRLDDLEKVTGGGSEAFWLRANQGLHFDIDKDIELDETAEQELDEELELFMNKMQRYFRSRGTKVKALGSDVANFVGPVAAIMQQISSGTGIPQRILAGSERGELSSTQDRDNWFDQTADRRKQFAGPNVINQWTDRGIEFGFLPTPKQYFVRWSQLKSLDDGQKADLAIKMSTVNKYCGETVVTVDEIRDKVFEYPPMTQAQKDEEAAKLQAKAALKTPVGTTTDPNGNQPAAPKQTSPPSSRNV